MGGSSKIEWTDATWNPVRGCSVVSPGCENCYAMNVAARFSGPGEPYAGLARFSPKRRLPQWTGKVRLVPEHLADPLRWEKPRRVFVNSMSDLFHESLSNESIAAVFGIMAAAPMHTFQILTKRSTRMREWFDWYEGASGAGASSYAAVLTALMRVDAARDGKNVVARLRYQADYSDEWPLPNVWLGVSAEDQERANQRVPELLRMPAAVRFVSYEPALGPVDFTRIAMGTGHIDAFDTSDGDLLDWVIVGGESGPRARPFDIAWARSVVRQCHDAGVPCFVKQLGRSPFDSSLPDFGSETFRLKDRKGGDWSEWPSDLRVRQYPEPAEAT